MNLVHILILCDRFVAHCSAARAPVGANDSVNLKEKMYQTMRSTTQTQPHEAQRCWPVQTIIAPWQLASVEQPENTNLEKETPTWLTNTLITVVAVGVVNVAHVLAHLTVSVLNTSRTWCSWPGLKSIDHPNK